VLIVLTERSPANIPFALTAESVGNCKERKHNFSLSWNGSRSSYSRCNSL